MRIYLDMTPFVTTSAMRGIGRYVQGLVQGLYALPAEARGDLELRGVIADRELTRLSVIDDVQEYCARPPAAPVPNDDLKRARLITFGAARVVPPGALLHLTDPKGIPLSNRLRYTFTSHDLISLALPELYLPKVPYWSNLYAAIERVRFGRAARILAVSHATRRDICDKLGVPESRVDVVWHGVDHERFHPREAPGESATIAGILGTDEPYLLYLGAGDARKDLDTLVRAYAQSRLRDSVRLVIAGRHKPPRVESLKRLIESEGVAGRALQLGYVEDLHVPALYRNAWAHAFLSRYEGFGLPVLEALACGTPTITSPGSSLDEISGDAALVVPCGDVEALRRTLDRLWTDQPLRDGLRARGLAHAASFTWEDCARKTVAFWRSASERAPEAR